MIGWSGRSAQRGGGVQGPHGRVAKGRSEFLRELLGVWHVDRPAEGTALTKAHVVDQNDEDVRRSGGGFHFKSRRSLCVAGIEHGARHDLRLWDRQYGAIECGASGCFRFGLRQRVVPRLGSRFTIEMPAGGTPVATPATYLISSVPIAALDDDHPAAVRAAPLQVFGIGGGPRAVGSVAIEQLAFARASVGARFSYFAKSEFSQARAQVQQFRRAGDKTEIVPIFDSRKSNLSVGRQTGDWPGTASGSPAPSRGGHRLQVTGWFTTDDRSWVAALAPDLVFQ